MSNVLEGLNPDEMKAGETYRVVYRGENRIGETRRELGKVEETLGVRMVTLELPDNDYNILQDLAMFYDHPVERLVKSIIDVDLECELAGRENLSSNIGKFLTKKRRYDSRAFRKEAS